MVENLAFKSLESRLKQINKKQDFSLEIAKLNLLQPRPKLLSFQFDNVYAGGLKSKTEVSPTQIDKYSTLDNAKYYQLNRGGQVTWHGKGQLTSYLLIDLKAFQNLTAKCYVNNVLLNSIIQTLKKYNIDSYSDDVNPGVWINGNEKIASVGIRVKHGITEFGIALNVNPNLKFLNSFEMCGLKNKQATSIFDQSGMNPSINEVSDEFGKNIAQALNLTIETIEI